MEGKKYRPIDQDGCRRLADAIGHDEQASAGFLRKGEAKAFVEGDPAQPAGAIIQWDCLPAEPVGVGSDPGILYEILQSVDGWTAVDVDYEVAEPLGKLIEERTGRGVHYVESLDFELRQPVKVVRHELVRELGAADASLFDEPIVADFKQNFGIDPREHLGGSAAGAIVDGRAIGLVAGGNVGDGYADLGAYFVEKYRGRGYGTAATSIVCGKLQAQGLIPVWSTGEGNAAALALLRKLGFELSECGRYVVLSKPG